MIAIFAVFLIATVMMCASFDAILKDRRRIERAKNASDIGQFAPR